MGAIYRREMGAFLHPVLDMSFWQFFIWHPGTFFMPAHWQMQQQICLPCFPVCF